MSVLRRFTALPTAFVTAITVVLIAVAARWSRTDTSSTLSAEATRGPLTVLTTAGTLTRLQPVDALRYE